MLNLHTLTVKLTVEELNTLIKSAMILQGFKATNINFEISQETDYRGDYYNTKLSGVEITLTKE